MRSGERAVHPDSLDWLADEVSLALNRALSMSPKGFQDVHDGFLPSL